MKTNFFNETHDFQNFIINNMYLLGKYKILSQQLITSSNEVGILDILAIDEKERRLTIIELKNDDLLDKGIWQPIRYYDLIKRGEDDVVHLLSNLQINPIDINLNPKILLVVPSCNEQLLRSLSYFENIDISVLEITKKVNKNMIDINKKTYYPISIVHKENLTKINYKKTHFNNIDDYREIGVNQEKIKIAKDIINKIKSILLSKNSKFDVFYLQSKISIMKDNKKIMELNIVKNPINYKLSLSFNYDGVPNKQDFMYMPGLEKYSFNKNKINLTISSNIERELLKKYI